jgi:hypothetical protein
MQDASMPFVTGNNTELPGLARWDEDGNLHRQRSHFERVLIVFGWIQIASILKRASFGVVIAIGAYARTTAVTAVLAYGILEVFGSLLLALSFKMSRQIDK